MPAKPLSPEAAQKRVWAAELKTITQNRRKVVRDIAKARKASAKDLLAAQRKDTALRQRLLKWEPLQLKSIDRRIGILNGRLGL